MVPGTVVDGKGHDDTVAAGSEEVAHTASSHIVHVCGIQFAAVEFERESGCRRGLILTGSECKVLVEEGLFKAQVGVEDD